MIAIHYIKDFFIKQISLHQHTKRTYMNNRYLSSTRCLAEFIDEDHEYERTPKEDIPHGPEVPHWRPGSSDDIPYE